jgi:hypothetical protein
MLDPALAATLRRFGYDIEPARSGHAAGESIIARRDLGNRVILIAIDAGGRFRVEITQVIAERAAADTIAEVAPVRVVETITRTLMIAGTIADRERMADIIVALEGYLAGPTEADEHPPFVSHPDFLD